LEGPADPEFLGARRRTWYALGVDDVVAGGHARRGEEERVARLVIGPRMDDDQRHHHREGGNGCEYPPPAAAMGRPAATVREATGRAGRGGLTAAARRGHSGHFGCACNSTHDLPRVTVVTECHQPFRRGNPPPQARCVSGALDRHSPGRHREPQPDPPSELSESADSIGPRTATRHSLTTTRTRLM